MNNEQRYGKMPKMMKDYLVQIVEKEIYTIARIGIFVIILLKLNVK